MASPGTHQRDHAQYDILILLLCTMGALAVAAGVAVGVGPSIADETSRLWKDSMELNIAVTLRY